MADPQAALATQLRNIEAKTGQPLAALFRLIADSGLSKVGEQRSMLMQTLGLGYGDANTLALKAKEAREAAAAGPAADAADPLDALYAGPKAALRPLHQQLMAQIRSLGAFDEAPKKACISLRRKKQFAMLGPATRDQLELGLNAKDLSGPARLKVVPAGAMCNYTVRLSQAADIDAELMAWVQKAYDAAG